jgi:hypothetical protein
VDRAGLAREVLEQHVRRQASSGRDPHGTHRRARPGTAR